MGMRRPVSTPAMMQMISDFKPEVLLLDLHLPEERHFTPDFIKSQLGSVPHTLAVSLSNDAEAKALAVSYGAESLLDKMKLYDQMIPAIVGFCKIHEIRYPGRKTSESVLRPLGFLDSFQAIHKV
jgi:hypothetical protein